MKESLNNIDIFAIVEEVSPTITGNRIKNIYNVEGTKILITYKDNDNRQLLVDVPSRIHLTDMFFEKPREPSKFIMTLRKYLRNKRVIGFYQREHLDRIVIIEILGDGQEILKLVFEFFGKGNVILLRPDGTVLTAQRYMKLDNEVVLANKHFDYPRQQFLDIFETGVDDLASILEGSTDGVSKVLSRNFNLNPFHAEELCLIAGIDKVAEGSTLSHEDLDRLHSAIRDFKQQLDEKKFSPRIVYKDAELSEKISVEPFQYLKHAGLPVKTFTTYNKAVDEYFSSQAVKQKSREKERKKKKLSKNERILVSQQEQLKNLEERAERYGRQGDLLYQYFQPLQQLLDTVYKARKAGMSWDEIIEKLEIGKERGIEAARLFYGVVRNQPVIKVKLDGEILELDIRLDLTGNINQLYYDKRKKALRKIPGAKKTIERMEKLVEKEQQEKAEREGARVAILKRRKQAWFEKFRWFYSSDGYLVVAGRDAGTNELLVGKYLEPGDLFFHSETPGAPVVIVKGNEGEGTDEIPITTLLQAARFGISYSRDWRDGHATGDMYAVRHDQVSKTPQAGEFLPKGSFVIRGDRNYFRNVRLEVAIGVTMVRERIELEKLREGFDKDEVLATKREASDGRVELEYQPVVLAGPLEALEQYCKEIVLLKPRKDGITAGRLASQLRARFTGWFREILDGIEIQIPIEEIQRWLPPGRSVISRRSERKGP